MLLSVVVALYNEEESVGLLFENLRKLLRLASNTEFEFILVNDGSKDGTLKALGAVMSPDVPARVVSHSSNKGFGAAMRTGIDEALGDIIICYDADCTYPVEDIMKLVDKIKEGYDVASGNPFFEKAVVENVPVWRQFLTWTNAILYKVVLGKASGQVTIMSCAFRAYKREVVKNTPFKSNGFGAASELLGRLIIAKHKIVEIPSTLTTRQFGQSKMNVRKAAIEHLKNVVLFFKIRFLRF